MTEKPPWRVALEQFERSIGAPLEEYIKTDEFADLAANAAKNQANAQRELAAGTTAWLHAMNLPTASDIAELREEIAALRAEVLTLSKSVKQSAGRPAAERPATKPGPSE